MTRCLVGLCTPPWAVTSEHTTLMEWRLADETEISDTVPLRPKKNLTRTATA